MDLWWERNGLQYDANGKLVFEDNVVECLAEKISSPLFLYSARRIQDNITRVDGALRSTGVMGRVFYALKANRFAPLLTYIKTHTQAGVDVCSPTEVLHAMSCGFKPEDISYTGTSVSNRDLDFLCGFPDLLLNCDGLSMIRRVGERAPGRTIGIRINPAIGTGYGSNELLRYSGDKPTKFGIYASELDAALRLADSYDLKVTRVHFHTGCGYLNDQLPVWESILEQCLQMIERIPTVESVNLGGGLGVPLCEEDQPLDIDAWSSVIKRVFGGKTYQVCVEPGTYIVKDAGLLILEANTVESKSGHRFIGVDGGFQLAMEPAHYKLPCEPVLCSLPDSKEKVFDEQALQATTFAGNINEALDVWKADFLFPEISEGEPVAFINAGAYTSSMSSNHCMRGAFTEILLLD